MLQHCSAVQQLLYAVLASLLEVETLDNQFIPIGTRMLMTFNGAKV